MKNILKRVLGALVAGMVIVSPLSAVAPAITAYADKTLTASPSHTQEVGWYNDYHHEIWQADTPNSSTIIAKIKSVYGSGKYKYFCVEFPSPTPVNPPLLIAI